MEQTLTQARLQELLNYNPDTGEWKRNKAVKGCSKDKPVGRLEKGYLRISIDEKLYRAHRLVWLYVYGFFPSEQIDHINGIKSDNRLCNLRLASRSQNQWNAPAKSTNTSGYKGVSFQKRLQKWQASIQVFGRQKHLGHFSTAEDAHKAYVSAAEQLHGEFARVA